MLRAAMIPAMQFGGDLYDILWLDARHLLLNAADGAGKGPPAGHDRPCNSARAALAWWTRRSGSRRLGSWQIPYVSGPVALVLGQALPYSSDGVTEAKDGQGGLLGRDRMAHLSLVAKAARDVIITAVLSPIGTFAGEAPQADAITAPTFRFHH